ncbi:MAG TPA: hypothetical protein VF144_15395, partial [Chitinophagaceae bacterium]
MKQLVFLIVGCVYNIVLPAQSGFVIYPGTQFVKSGSPVLVLQNMNFVNNGTYSAGSGTVKLTGSNATYINGNNTTNFYNLHAGSSASLTLGQNINVQNELQMAGMLQVQDYEVKMQPNAMIVGESETARLHANAGNTGRATTTLDINSPAINLNPA